MGPLLFVTVLIALLRYRGTIRERHYLKRNALLFPYQSAWQKLWFSGDDSDLICTMGFDRQAFLRIHAVFDTLLPKARTGCPRILDSYGSLGLALHWLNSMMGGKHLCMIFGLVPASVSTYLGEAMDVLRQSLRLMPEARIRWPTPVNLMRNSFIIACSLSCSP